MTVARRRALLLGFTLAPGCRRRHAFDAQASTPRSAEAKRPKLAAADQPSAAVRRGFLASEQRLAGAHRASKTLRGRADQHDRRSRACQGQAAADGSAARRRPPKTWSRSTTGCAAAGSCCCSPTRCSNGRASGRSAIRCARRRCSSTPGCSAIGGCASTRRTGAAPGAASSAADVSDAFRRARLSGRCAISARPARRALPHRQGRGDDRRRRRPARRRRPWSGRIGTTSMACSRSLRRSRRDT